jgi:hypothetical protein
MTITFLSAQDQDYRDAFAVLVDGEVLMEFMDGEAEDASLSRDYNDLYQIPDLVNKVIKAREVGYTVELKYETLKWSDYCERMY